jgi:hypothetical protein
MQYVAFVGSEGRSAPEAIETMRRDIPAWEEEMDRRGVRLFGRELDFPNTAVTVRVREGETLVTDGPFAETKEFIAGFDVLDCADLDEAAEVAGTSPVARFHAFEVRPFRDGLRLGPGARAFGQMEDSAGIPYLLTVWADGKPAAPLDEDRLRRDCDAWRQDLQGQGVLVLGDGLQGPDSATTLRPGGERIQRAAGPMIDLEAAIVAIDVVSCAGREQAVQLAAQHPMARYHAVEVRPFYTE